VAIWFRSIVRLIEKLKMIMSDVNIYINVVSTETVQQPADEVWFAYLSFDQISLQV
jgi:hypothetical protein